MEIESSFYELSSQRDEAYHKEVKALIRRNDSQSQDGVPPNKRPRLSQDSGVGYRQDDCIAADGTIRSITLINFMCHAHLTLEFNPKVNFLIGQNGSGKSAILTAITVGLGAQARETGRGRSLKDLIKNGESSACVIIELFNKKKRPHLKLEGGKIVTIKRTIGGTSSVQIKCQNRIVSTRMDYMHNLLRDMGIQINNPISVLDQNTSKTFLAQSTSAVKYELFMRATALEDIKTLHDEIKMKIHAIEQETEHKQRDLNHRQNFNKNLINQYKEVEALVGHRRDRAHLLEELLWSKVNSLQIRLREREKKLEQANQECREHRRLMEAENNEDTYAEDIARLDEILDKKAKDKLKLEKNIKYGKFELTEVTSNLGQEEQDFKKTQIAMKRAKDFIAEYHKHIEKEVALGDPTERVKKQRETIKTLEEQVKKLEEEVEAKEREKFKVQADASTFEQEFRHLRIAKQQLEEKKSKIERNVRTISQDSSNLSIYHPQMPELIRQIDAAAKSFRKKPIGPLGLYVKLLDESWGAAVEHVTGAILTAFCVDNGSDYEKLKGIMQRVCNSNMPNIIKTSFTDRVHDTSRKSVKAPPHPNIQDVLEFSHPMAANLLIDKCSIENVLLIADEAVCQQMLSNIQRVPQNCTIAVTRKCDTYHPAPLYRTYSGFGRTTARYLKTSREAVLQNMRNELNETTAAIREYDDQLREMNQKVITAKAKARELDQYSQAASSKLRQLNNELNNLKNQEEPEESMVVSLRAELRLKEEEVKELTSKLMSQSEEIKKLRGHEQEKRLALRELQKQWEDVKAEERKIKEEKESIEETKAKSSQQRENRKEVLDKLTEDIEHLESEVNDFRQELSKSTEEAEAFDAVGKRLGDEVSLREAKRSKRKPIDVEKDLKAVDTKIAVLQRKIGDDEDTVVRKYQEMKKRTADLDQLLRRNGSVTKALKQAMEFRTQVYTSLMRMNKIAIDNTFRKVLRQRGYKGSLSFENSKMEINIGLSDDDSRSTSTLSGGERSFGTMALLIALWYVTKLPFYFMDEFDVFMDMANRETIMSLMMDYTRKRSYQFCFLTPLNTSSIQADKDVTIHSLEPPRKNGTAV